MLQTLLSIGGSRPGYSMATTVRQPVKDADPTSEQFMRPPSILEEIRVRPTARQRREQEAADAKAYAILRYNGLINISDESQLGRVRRKAPSKPRLKAQPVPATPKAPEPVKTPEIDPDGLENAILFNGYDPANPPPLKKGYYACNIEMFHVTCQIVKAGGTAYANERITIKRGREPTFIGTYGERFCEVIYLLANRYLGRIAFSDQGSMCNMAEDLVQEAAAKCTIVAHRFKPWCLSPTQAAAKTAKAHADWMKKPEARRLALEAKGKGPKVYDPKVNNPFAYFTTVTRNRMFETLDCALKGHGGPYLDDLLTFDAQTIGDIV